ncbi:MAG: phosphatidate cytidylyltransferase [Candidatus Dormibacteraeota bacterium]|nr:phosphatidate cytidylyltransferase [Candidatus Dormibacteraeota bacterium]MBO0703775.1 phosphatidate cytidylyltransferase [Candidatus Dormibacteraeota bacterium]MBO0759779.1 phosphatidate cytidylyltransferase [Candidatus Dormibacteraeota bacterium]
MTLELEPRTPWRPHPFLVRVVSAAALIAVFAGMVALGRAGVVALTVLVVGLALWEFAALSERLGYRAPIWLLFPFGYYLALSGTELRWIPFELVLAIVPIVGLTVLLFPPSRRDGIGRWAMAVAGALYIGLPFNYLLLLYSQPSGFRGLFWLVILVAALALSDTAALLVGKSVGRRPFLPTISPRKTWEGAIGGLLCAIAVMGLGTTLLLAIPWWLGVLLGLAVGVLGTAGDLVESQMKRLAGVKDSSNLIPGHGGILDRLDSMLFAPAVVYFAAAMLHVL